MKKLILVVLLCASMPAFAGVIFTLVSCNYKSNYSSTGMIYEGTYRHFDNIVVRRFPYAAGGCPQSIEVE